MDMLKDLLRRFFEPFDRKKNASNKRSPYPGLFPRQRGRRHSSLFSRPSEPIDQEPVMVNDRDFKIHFHKTKDSGRQEVLLPKITEELGFFEPSPLNPSKNIKRNDEGSEWQSKVSIQQVLGKLDDIKSAIDQLRNEHQQGQQRFEHSFNRLEKSVQRIIQRWETTTEQKHGDSQQPQDEALIKRSNLLEADNEELARKNIELQTANDEYAAKLVILQPRRCELLPDAAGGQFKALVAGIDSWVSEQVYRVVPDSASETRFLQRMKENAALTRPFRDVLQRDSDLSKASLWPECEIEIISAFVSRFLYHEIFKGPIYGFESPSSTLIETIAKSMAQHTNPQKDPSAIRAWVAESYQAMTAAPENQQHRGKALKGMTEKLAGFLCFLAPPRGEQEFQRTLGKEIIEPTFRLQESILCSSYRYFFNLQQASEVNQSVHACRSVKKLTGILDDLDLRNVAENHSKVVFQKLEPQPSLGAFRSGFQPICPLYPALMFAGAEGSKEPQEPVVVERQRMLIAWVPRGSKTSPPGQNASWIHRLIQMKK